MLLCETLPWDFFNTQSRCIQCMSKLYELKQNNNTGKKVKCSQITFFPFSNFISWFSNYWHALWTFITHVQANCFWHLVIKQLFVYLVLYNIQCIMKMSSMFRRQKKILFKGQYLSCRTLGTICQESRWEN